MQSSVRASLIHALVLTFKNFGSKVPFGPEFFGATAMTLQCRVIDLGSSAIDPDERVVQSTSPERAVMQVLGVEV